MTATWTPGLPSVVSALVSSISRPAFAPERTWIAASLPPAAAMPCDPDIDCAAATAGAGEGLGAAWEAVMGFVGCVADTGGGVCAVAIAAAACGASAGFGVSPALGAAPGRSTIVFSNSGVAGAFAI